MAFVDYLQGTARLCRGKHILWALHRFSIRNRESTRPPLRSREKDWHSLVTVKFRPFVSSAVASAFVFPQFRTSGKMSRRDSLDEVAYPSLWVLATSAALCYAVFTAIYRLHFHPLAKFPGPFWARLTVIPSWWHTRTGDRHIWLYRLQEEYGMFDTTSSLGVPS